MSRAMCWPALLVWGWLLAGIAAVGAQEQQPAAASGQETTTPAADEKPADEKPADEKPAVAAEQPVAGGGAAAAPGEASVSRWDRLIYVPFRELQKVFDKQAASVVLPYAEYMELMKHYLESQHRTNGQSPDAVVTETSYAAVVEQDIVRITAQLKLNVLREKGWAAVPLTFGAAAVGRVTSDQGQVLLQGVGPGQYQLLLQGSGLRTVTVELLATVRTSPEHKSFQIQCPPAGISQLTLTVPEADQSVTISPLQVLLPLEAEAAAGTTVVRANLGATDQFEVRWNAKAGTRPVMDLLTSVANTTEARIEPGLLQARTTLDYEILRGELREVAILAPADARIIDVVSSSGRVRAWTATAVGDTHQLLRIELLSPVTDRFQVELQTERSLAGDTLQLVGRSADGKLQGVHADGVIREAGRVVVSTDPSLTITVKSQTGLRQVDAGTVVPMQSGVPAADGRQAWEFSGTSGQLILQTRPVEPRLLVQHDAQLTFSDSELRLRSVLKYTVERAGVFQLVLNVPASLTVDRVSADGMSEFQVDKDSGRITLSLTQKRLGAVEVTIQAHQPFDANSDLRETELPLVTPDGVERETGVVSVYAPQFLDVSTVDEKLVGVFPAREAAAPVLARLRHIGSWEFTRRPVAVFVRTAPRPAQLSAVVATTVRVEPEITKLSSRVQFEIQNAGIDTFRIAVPESVAADVRFQAVTPGHVIQQRTRADQAVDGWVTWTLVLQDETTGTVAIAVDWEVTGGAASAAAPAAAGSATAAAPVAAEAAAGEERSLLLQPPQALPPFTAEQAERRRVTLTQTRGELRLLRHESLSITAEGQGETMEAVDVRELELLEPDGYLAFRYFSQPAAALVQIRRHEIHEVVATVVTRAAIEIVTEKQELAAYRCRFRITSSERQRLLVDLPAGSELQAPLLNGQRTTMERAMDAAVEHDREAYYVNISREQTSDQDFLLTLQFRCPIVAAGQIPWDRYGGSQILRLPLIGSADGSTVLQQIQLALWAPKDVSLIGEPPRWSQIGRPDFALLRPFDSPSSTNAASQLDDWLNDTSGGAGDFATQGHVAVFRAVGRQEEIEVSWRNRPFLFWILSGTLVVLGLILRGTTWENRITLVLLALFGVALWSLQDGYATLQFVTAAFPGAVVVAAIWLAGLLLGARPGASGPPATPPGQPPHAGATGVHPQAAALAAVAVGGSGQSAECSAPTSSASSVPPISPSPDVTRWMNDLMGGKQ